MQLNQIALVEIQSAIGWRFGTKPDTSTGAAALLISHDSVTLIDKNNRIVAENVESVIAYLDSQARKPEAVILDALASELIGWYAKNNDRRPADIVNGLVAGNLAHLRRELDSQYTDDSGEHIREYVMEAITRRS